ncbi:ABC transporter substrate-binding protein [Aquabacterium sp. OR-4]|uniref:ABC transporter substrate-binding protein n=1 Tax=Aquabacterium sp. OR-4 TaxID=2978127 RepID=UPI0021B29F39|nr:ABC transporter substrate-binding protein [Aquabacterium sp. OR-4]MDT7837262.1 ABC transporter substrate-binding protein [Aquabacterium sp. OR-4]
MTPSSKPAVLACTLAALVLAMATAPSHAQTQGVSKTEIVIGTIQDLSGPVSAYGKQARNGAQLRVDEINEQGGIHGRKLRLVVEDSAYDPKRAVLAAQKLVNQDKVFLITSHIGTPQNNAAMPIQFEKNVVNFMPLSAGREMFDPVHKLKFANVASYHDTLKVHAPELYKQLGAKKPCALYQDDDYGLEVLRGAESGMKSLGLELAEKTSYKRGATDFSSQVAKMKSAGCDFVVLGTIIRETVGAMAEAAKVGWKPSFLASVAAYTDLIHKLGGKATEGLYAVMTIPFPYLDDSPQPVRFWATKYKTRFNEDPSTYAVGTYQAVDIFARAAQKAGPNLSTESFVKAMETMGTIAPDIFGAPPLTWTATQRLGSTQSRLSQIKDGRWKVISEYR